MKQDLTGLVAVVSGSSRGIGRGMAVAMGAHGATVYVTGRTAKPGQSEFPGSVAEAAEAVTAAGGKGIGVACDFGDDEQIKQLFARIEQEQGRLDILVNNAAYLNNDIYAHGPFWSKSLDIVRLLDVGLRSSYIASWYAAPLMVRQKRGLIVNTSTYGAVSYIHGPAYGVHKAGHDKLAADMAVDFRDHGVAAVSYWFGAVATERFKIVTAGMRDGYAAGDAGSFQVTETPEFGGHVLAAMYHDPELMTRSGNAFIVAEMAKEYGIKDADGVEPPSYREYLGAPRIPHPSVIT
ncbi:MAG: family NAD(P)-dependent oxidoreductase [Nevskia sp.]|nr:family NAD(P)-dependent oxidoreductase [Nevskia sp.]